MKVAVHNGGFHSDDVFAVAILKIIYPDLMVIRSRDPDVLAQADIRVDVGRKYSPPTDFDHHQGAGKRENGIPYASAGLVWKHFGEKLCSGEAWKLVDEALIQPIDAMDEGVEIVKEKLIQPYDIQYAISAFYPTWKDEKDYDSSFMHAVDFAIEVLKREIHQKVDFAAGKQRVREIMVKKEGYVLLEEHLPWQDVVINETDALFCVFFNGKDWVVKAVPKRPFSYARRKDLPKKWGGLEGEKLQKVTGVKDAIFCHSQLFTIHVKSRESAIKLAEYAVKN